MGPNKVEGSKGSVIFSPICITSLLPNVIKEINVFFSTFKQKNWVFATNSNLIIPISLQPYGANLWYFKLRLLSISINSLKYLRSTTMGYKDIEIRKSEFVAKTQLLLWRYFYLVLYHIFFRSDIKPISCFWSYKLGTS